MVEKRQHLFLAEHDRQFVRPADVREIFVGPGHLQGIPIEELHRGNILVDGFRRQLALVEQVELILADGFDVEDLGTSVEILGEAGDVMEVVFLSRRRQIAQLHVFDHAFS